MNKINLPNPLDLKQNLADGLMGKCSTCKGKGKMYFTQGEDVKEDVCDICQGEGVMYVQNGEDDFDAEVCHCQEI